LLQRFFNCLTAVFERANRGLRPLERSYSRKAVVVVVLLVAFGLAAAFLPNECRRASFRTKIRGCPLSIFSSRTGASLERTTAVAADVEKS